jgi:hypothetical protein
MTERADHRICINAPAQFKALVQTFLENQCITQVCQHFYSPELAPCDLCFFPKINIAVESEEICECERHTVHKVS